MRYRQKYTHCPYGHPYEGKNLYVDKSSRRHCRTCMRARTKRWYQVIDGPRRKAKRAQRRTTFAAPKLESTFHDPLFCSWLAGFTDGEGCFSAQIRGEQLTLCFAIHLRADDRPLLEMIQKTLRIGKLYDRQPRHNCKLKENPSVVWTVRSCRELYGVILPIFDAFPLRSKKHRDYVIWREIIVLAASQRRGGGKTILSAIRERVEPLVHRLIMGRKYLAPEIAAA